MNIHTCWQNTLGQVTMGSLESPSKISNKAWFDILTSWTPSLFPPLLPASPSSARQISCPCPISCPPGVQMLLILEAQDVRHMSDCHFVTLPTRQCLVTFLLIFAHVAISAGPIKTCHQVIIKEGNCQSWLISHLLAFIRFDSPLEAFWSCPHWCLCLLVTNLTEYPNTFSDLNLGCPNKTCFFE